MKKNKWVRFNETMLMTAFPAYLVFSLVKGSFKAWTWTGDEPGIFCGLSIVFMIVSALVANGAFDSKN